MTKEEIYEKISGWIERGLLVQRSSIVKDSGYWYSVWRLVGSDELFFTGNERIVATDRVVRDEFQAMLDSHRVMSLTDVTIWHPECKSANDVKKLVKQGRMLRVEGLSSVTLYVE